MLPAIGRELLIPDVAIAAIFSLSALMWTLSAPFWAAQSDRRGRKGLVQLGMFGYFVSTLLCAFVIYAGIEALIAPLLIVSLFALFRSLFGIFGSASNPAAQAYVAVRTNQRDRTAAISVLASAFGLGTIVGPAVAPFFIFPIVGLSRGRCSPSPASRLVVLFLVGRYLPKDSAEEIARNRARAAATPPLVRRAHPSVRHLRPRHRPCAGGHGPDARLLHHRCERREPGRGAGADRHRHDGGRGARRCWRNGG